MKTPSVFLNVLHQKKKKEYMLVGKLVICRQPEIIAMAILII